MFKIIFKTGGFAALMGRCVTCRLLLVASILLASSTSSLYGQQFINCGGDMPTSQIAFGAGERLSYSVSYKGSIFTSDVADIIFTTSFESYAGKDSYKIEAVGKTRPFFSFFFTLEDTYVTWVDAITLRPIKATSNLKEGDYRYRSSMDFAWPHKRVYTEGRNLKRNDGVRKVLKLKDCSYDALALFYNVRCADLTGIAVGTQQSLDLVLEDTVRTIRFRYLGREVRKVDKMGEFSTLKFACQFATSSDDSFKDGAEFFIWLTDDKNHIPVYLESPIKVGKVYATLSSYSGLKHPLSSFKPIAKNR